jgi:nucleotide-binding universal stress UspA family protein
MKIIVPVDFSANSLNALEFGVYLAGQKDGEIILIHVIEAVFDFASKAAVALKNLHNEAEALMVETLKKYKDSNLKFTTIIKEGTASIAVARLANEIDSTLIVMGTLGASGIKLALMGSTAINVIKESAVPVLIVPSESNAHSIKKVALALEFAHHEEKFIDWVIDMSLRWKLGMEFVHVQTQDDLDEEPRIKKLEDYVGSHHAGLPIRIHTFYAQTAVEGLDQFLEENENVILVMCHQHRNLWKQILTRSQTLQMIFHTRVPLLVMP